MLLERPGETVTREELRNRLWTAETFVDFGHGVNKAVNRIRDALGDSATSPRFVETAARRGYRFIADVTSPKQLSLPVLRRRQVISHRQTMSLSRPSQRRRRVGGFHG